MKNDVQKGSDRAAGIAAVCFLSAMLLCGCGKNDTQYGLESAVSAGAGAEENGAETSVSSERTESSERAESSETAESSEMAVSQEYASGALDQDEEEVKAVQGGPYGEISITLPSGWGYEAYPVDSEELYDGMYGIRFFPRDAQEGYVDLVYTDFFGVCGTGLETTSSVIAGSPAEIGVYDNHAYWDFVSFREQNEGIEALIYKAESWWGQYGAQVPDILDTLAFDRDRKEGGAYIYNGESEAENIGLQFRLKNISATGAKMVFRQYDKEAPTGELQYGQEFGLEREEEDGSWAEVPVALEGEYGFHAIAYLIAADDTTEEEIRWEWLYGRLAPGNYRLRKEVMDFRGGGDFDIYTVYAYFLLN